MGGNKHIAGLFGLLLGALSIKAQENLVYNPGFEEYWYCTPVISQDSFPCKHWWVPNLSTPDYYNPCSRDPNLRAPENINGYYESHSGTSYIGFLPISIETADMEHIQGHLIEPLKQGKQYKVSFWMRLAHQSSDYAGYNIGLFFSDKKILTGARWETKENYIAVISPEYTAHVSNAKGNFITDTSWVEISRTYTAKGGEKYITIGMFWDDNPNVVKEWEKAREKDKTGGEAKRFGKKVKKYLLKKNPYMEKKYKNAPSKLGQHFPYYFIDDVSVISVDQ